MNITPQITRLLARQSMKFAFVILSALCLLVCGCKSMFGFSELPGDHWRIALGAGDPQPTPQSAAVIGGVLAQRLRLTLYRVEPESWHSPISTAPLSGATGAGNIAVTVTVDRRTSEIVLESRYYESRMFGNNPDGPKMEQDMAQKVLLILKELYPNSTATPFIRHAGPLGP